jgi:hypothetical protein
MAERKSIAPTGLGDRRQQPEALKAPQSPSAWKRLGELPLI